MSGKPEDGGAGVREIRTAWATMADGVRLALSLWLPDVSEPVPAVLESIPYRRGDSTRAHGRWWGRKLAARGVAYARLDIRGSGDSEGVLTDEYLPQEQQDAAAVIAWLAAQPWCNGAVGMRGVSWGGFAALQTAAKAPPALKAAMVFCASDRRFTDDAHYVGGAFALTGMKWAASFKLVMAGPPDPEVVGEEWARIWRRRLEAAPPIAADWLGHQREDAYWRQGSVGLDPGAIRCPVYLVGGWADPYNEAIARLTASLEVPCKSAIGPWGHGYPQPAFPGPALDWIEEEARWWRHWLAGDRTAVMDSPRVRLFLPDAAPAKAPGEDAPGGWIGATRWAPGGRALRFGLRAGRLTRPGEGGGAIEVRTDPAVGLAMAEWCPFAPSQLAQDQSADDARSAAFDGEPLAEPLDLVGKPRLTVTLTSSAPVARLAARLCEVDAEGRSWLIAWGLINLTHREDHAAPSPLPVGEPVRVQLPLSLAARRVRPGSRLRLALSEGLWPLVWPSPEPVSLALDLGAAELTLPLRSDAWRDCEPPAPSAPGSPGTPASWPRLEAVVDDDGGVRFEEVTPPSQSVAPDTGMSVERSGVEVFAGASTAAPAGEVWRVRQGVRYRRGDFDCALTAEVELTSTATHFILREQLTARGAGIEPFAKAETTRIARDLM